MQKKISRAVLGGLAALILQHPSFAYESRLEARLRIEADFKNIGTAIVGLLSEELSDSTWKEKIIKHRWKLKSFVDTYPESVWADDAQYIFGVLAAPEGMLVQEFEYLLARFPDAEAEPWTLEMFEFMIPGEAPLDFAVRKHLCVNYAATKKKGKLARLVKDSVERYPERAATFQKFLEPKRDRRKQWVKFSKKALSFLKNFPANVIDRSSFPVKAERR